MELKYRDGHLVLGIKLFFELRDFPLLGSGKVLGIVLAHVAESHFC